MDNTETNAAPAEGGGEGDAGEINGEPTVRPGNRKRRRGSRGGRNRKRPTADGAAGDETGDDGDDRDDG